MTKEKCNFGPAMCTYDGSRCPNEGTHYRDRTITGIGDIRHFCDAHIAEADAYFRIVDAEKTVRYLKSVVDHKEIELTKAKEALAEAQSSPLIRQSK